MPTLSELRNRYPADNSFSRGTAGCEETLVHDDRSRITPAQMVDQKLRAALRVAVVSPIDGKLS